MNTSYPIPAGENKIELEINRSKFIAYAINVTDREHADAFVTHLKKTNPRSNHVCWAFIAGAPETTARSMSDDGEPSGTRLFGPIPRELRGKNQVKIANMAPDVL